MATVRNLAFRPEALDVRVLLHPCALLEMIILPNKQPIGCNINLQHNVQTKRSNRKRKANVRLGEIREICAPKTISTKITKKIAVVKNVPALHEHDYTQYGFR